MRSTCDKIFEILVVLLLLTAHSFAQPKCKVEFYSTEQGLSHQAITAMVKDKEGFMWFGSWDGINRFDGHIFSSFKSSAGDFSKLGNDRIDQILEDQSEQLWMEAYDRQIYRFDKKNNEFLPLANIINSGKQNKIIFKSILSANNGLVWLLSNNSGIFCVPQKNLTPGDFINFSKDAPAGYQLPDNNVNFFHEDGEKQIWIGTPDGLCCLNISASGHFKNLHVVPKAIAKGLNISAVEEDLSNLYFGTGDGQLIVYNKRSKVFSYHKISIGQIRYLCRSKHSGVIYASSSLGELISFETKTQKIEVFAYPSSSSLLSIYEDHRGRLWIEPEKTGVILFDPLSRSFTSFSKEVRDPYNSIGNRFKVLEDNNHNIWVNLKGGGFGFYDSIRNNFAYNVQTTDAINYALPNIVYNIYYDKSGVIWLATADRELIKIVLQSSNFKQKLLVEPDYSRWDNEVRGILYDDKTRLWLGLKSGRLVVYQNEKEINNLFVNEPKEGFGQVYSILQDRRGNIWLGTKGNGLFKATPVDNTQTKYRLTHFTYHKQQENSLHCNEIYTLLEDPSGRIWIGSFDNALTLVKERQDSVTFIQADNGYPTENFRKIRKLASDTRGNIWIATTDGLLIFNPDDNSKSPGHYKTYKKVPGDLQSLGNNDIQFICRDSKNRMWLGTAGGGFCLAIGDKPTEALAFKNFTTREGMPNDYVLSCVEDKRGDIWIATENGLSRFNPQTGSFRNYDSYDGLPKLAFSEASVCSPLPDGRLIFGTTKGYLAFDPGLININRIPANISLTNLQINNEDQKPGSNGGVLENGIDYLSELRLKYDQNIISIDYSIPDHRAGNRQVFAYRLIGFDTTWHDDRQQRRATYTNLPPGHFVFEVKSVSTDLYSNQPYKKLAITILPPPWRTWWAYCLYAILIFVLLYFIRRYGLAMIRLRNKIAVEQKLAALKLNFFTNVSHELRTPLTLIVNPLEEVARKADLNPELRGYVDVARKNAARMVHFINQLLDLRKAQSDKAKLSISRVEIISFVKKITEYFTEAARRKNIHLDIIADPSSFDAWIDAEKLDVVIYNLLGNAMKFTPEGKSIRIIVTGTDERSFSISISDQGPGVPEEKLEDIFELFQEINLSTKTALKGTGIGLALAREFVNLHHGTISAVNNEDGGLMVMVELKKGPGHFNDARVSFTDTPKIAIYPEEMHQASIPLPDQSNQDSDQAPLLLLVEDNEDMRTIISGQLRQFYRVESAVNGKEGLEKAMTLLPDLIVSDIMMPEMNGIEMMDKVKNNVNTSHIPVVLLSAKYSVESQIEGLRYGADYYITKPFNNEFLIASIDNLLRQRKKLFETLIEKKKAIELSPSPIVITSKDETFLKEVIRVVEEQMGDSGFNVESLSVSMFMNQNTFYKKFKSLTGLTIVEFVRDMRLQRAKQLLEAGGNNVSEVAYEVGFSNPKYFSTCFKQKYNVSPSDYVRANVT